MNKTITVERIYSQGDYQNITIKDTINEIPEAIATNSEALKLLRYLQLVDLEWSYLNYMKLRASEPKITNAESLEAATSFIEEERTITFEKLLSSIQIDKPKEEN